MTAAAAGQVVSDVSGVIMGGSLERVLQQLNLIRTPDLSSAQRRLSVCRNVSMAGAVCGVIVGCTLGATTLLLVDLEKRNRIERAQQLQVIVGDMIALQDGGGDASSEDEEGGSLQTESCCIYVSNADDFQVDNDPRHGGGRIGLKHLSPNADPSTPPIVRESAARNTVMLSPDRSVLYLPVREDDQVLAVLELRKRQPPAALSAPRRSKEGGSESKQVVDLQRVAGFSEADVRTAKVVARHLGIFMNRLCE
jgi:Transmembrane protein 65